MHRDSDKGAQAALANRSSVARIHVILDCVQKLFKSNIMEVLNLKRTASKTFWGHSVL